MGDMSSPFKDGVMGNPSVNPSVPISRPTGEALASPFMQGNEAAGASGGGVSIPQGENIAGPTPGTLATPFQEGAIAGKNKG